MVGTPRGERGALADPALRNPPHVPVAIAEWIKKAIHKYIGAKRSTVNAPNLVRSAIVCHLAVSTCLCEIIHKAGFLGSQLPPLDTTYTSSSAFEAAVLTAGSAAHSHRPPASLVEPYSRKGGTCPRTLPMHMTSLSRPHWKAVAPSRRNQVLWMLGVCGPRTNL